MSYAIIAVIMHKKTAEPTESMQSVMLSHGPISYRHAGEGPPLMLIHGWGGSSRYWQYTMEHFASMRHVYAPDIPGYGQSPPIEGESSSERLAETVIEFADTLGIEQFDLVAHSFGGSIVAHLAARWPERVRRLVLTCFSTYRNESERRLVDNMLRQMGMSLAMWQPWMALWHPWMGLWQSWMTLWMPPIPGKTPSIYQTIAWRFFYNVPDDEALLRESFSDFLRMNQRTSLDSITSSVSPTITAALQSITVPTLLIAARQDMIMPPSGATVVAEHIPNCRLVWIDECGHMPMIEHPETYHELVQRFLLTIL